MDMGRTYTIRTESIELATIEAGNQITVEVPDEAREIFASCVWFTSNHIPLSELGEEARLDVRNSCAGWKLLVPLLPLYYITVAKLRYLKLSVV